jgi:UDP-N-acetylglucosamine acyltransferase
MNTIHPSAIISPEAVIGKGNIIGPYTVISRGVELGDGNWIGSHVVLGSPAEMKNGSHGAEWISEETAVDSFGVKIGNENKIREFSTIHSGSAAETTIGDRNFLLRNTHVGHDCQIGSDVTIAGNTVLGGHVVVDDFANIGLGTAIHQRTTIGAGAMIGMASAVRNNVLPFTISLGNPARVSGINIVGLQRQGLNEKQIASINLWFSGKGPLSMDLPDPIRNYFDGNQDVR